MMPTPDAIDSGVGGAVPWEGAGGRCLIAGLRLASAAETPFMLPMVTKTC